MKNVERGVAVDAALFKKHLSFAQGLAVKTVRRRARFLAPEAVEDLKQEAGIALMKSLATYDPGRGTTLRAWISGGVIMHIKAAASRQYSNLVRWAPQQVWLDEPMRTRGAAQEGDGNSRGDLLEGATQGSESQADVRRLYARAWDAIANAPQCGTRPETAPVAEVYMRVALGGEKLADVGADLGFSRERARQLFRRGERRVKALAERVNAEVGA